MPRQLSSDDKMQLRGIGDLQHPGSCASCGNGTCQEGYVDLGIYYDYEGNVYLCVPCVTQAAETAGMLSLPESQALIATSTEIANNNAMLTEALTHANERLKSYDNLFGDAFSGVNPSDFGFSGPAVASSDAGEIVSETAGADGGPISSAESGGSVKDSKSTKPSKVEGPTEPTRIKRRNDGPAL